MAEYKPGDIPLAETDDRKLCCKFHYKGVLILLIPIAFGGLLAGKPVLIYRFLYLTICLYLYYILNVMASGAVAFIYITFIPIAGIAGSGPVSFSHYPDLMFLVYGTIMMGAVMDSSKLSQHLGFAVIRIVGSSFFWLQVLLAVVVSTIAILVNPTVGAAFGMKLAQAVVNEYNDANVIKRDSDEEPYEQGARAYPTRPVIGIFLTCCYTASLAASVSPFVNPNGILIKYSIKMEHIIMIMALPAFLGICIVILWLQILFMGLFGGSVKRDLAEMAENKEDFRLTVEEKRMDMGHWNAYAILVFILILILFVLLHTRRPHLYVAWENVGNGVETGLSIPAIFIGLLLFAIPANYLFCRYYVCREPDKPGTTPSLLSWKTLNNNVPWEDIFMLGAAFCCVFCGLKSGFYAKVAESMWGSKRFDLSRFMCGAGMGTLLSALSPSTTLAKMAVPVMKRAGYSFALPFMTALHNQFLLPISSPANMIVAGWGNIRPFQFLLAGIVPAIFFMLLTAASTMLCFDEVVSKGINSKF
ncbi:protein I'm not dead yet-like [Drosophila serrata]|uniref:protein I'm not dead yet-like n=1 Tax=Drosophila serrata TaxID=7274 RepID=UPI000A1D12DF|nr:protein I'm not dead yet-like [Drosophila serrata]